MRNSITRAVPAILILALMIAAALAATLWVRIGLSVAWLAVHQVVFRMHRRHFRQIGAAATLKDIRKVRLAPSFIVDAIILNCLICSIDMSLRHWGEWHIRALAGTWIFTSLLCLVFIVSVIRHQRDLLNLYEEMRGVFQALHTRVAHPNFDAWVRDNPERLDQLNDTVIKYARAQEYTLASRAYVQSVGTSMFEWCANRLRCDKLLLSPKSQERTQELLHLLAWFVPIGQREPMLADLAEMVEKLRAENRGENHIRLVIAYHLGIPLLSKVFKIILLLRLFR